MPVGALLLGAAAASGWVLGSRRFQTRPRHLLPQVIVAAALAQALIHYSEYSALLLGNGERVADRIGFLNYLEVRLTTAHLRLGGAQGDAGDVGSFGYWLAVFRFAGFVLGGLGAMLFIESRPACETCSRHLRELATGRQHINDRDAFDTYYENVLNLPMEGPEFADWMQYDPDRNRLREGTMRVTSVLQDCPCCRTQRVAQTIETMRTRVWRSTPAYGRTVAIPPELDLNPVFYGGAGRLIALQAA
jgi:hypothetical protein